MKTAISIPDKIFDSAELLARRWGVSRSELYTRAVAALVERTRGDGITERLNEICAEVDTSLDPVMAELQNRMLRNRN